MPNDSDQILSRNLGVRLRNAWNVFRNKDPIYQDVNDSRNVSNTAYMAGTISSYHPDMRRLRPVSNRTLISSIYTRIATDASMSIFRHVRTDDNGMFREEIDSNLNEVLNKSANIDQTGAAFISDFVLSMLDEGSAVGVPVDTSVDPALGSFDILTMRVGKVDTWMPDRVRIEVYNDHTGRREYVTMLKKDVAIVINPFYHIMNEPNSTAKRLSEKLALMDVVDDEIGSKKLNLIIQLPYVVKNRTKQEQADERRKQLESQLENSKLGVGYIDGTERIVQLNRPLENNLKDQVDDLTSMLYSQLGMTPEILNGTADESVMMNYYKRVIDVILKAICDEFNRKFLTKTARSQHQEIQFYREPFSLTPTTTIADIADKFTRNEILAPNEIRSIVGFMPSADEAANELRNRNINQSNSGSPMQFATTGEEGDEVHDVDSDFGSKSTDRVPIEELFT